MLFDTLRECNSVVSKLSLSYNEIDDECMKPLGKLIQDNHLLEHVHIGNNKITDKGVEILSHLLDGNESFKTLNLSGNKGVTDQSIEILLKVIEQSHIIDIDIRGTSIEIKKQDEFLIQIVLNKFKFGCEEVDLSNK